MWAPKAGNACRRAVSAMSASRTARDGSGGTSQQERTIAVGAWEATPAPRPQKERGTHGAPTHTHARAVPYLRSALNAHTVGLPPPRLAAEIEEEAHRLAARARRGDANGARCRRGHGVRGRGLEERREGGRAAHNHLEFGRAADARLPGGRGEIEEATAGVG